MEATFTKFQNTQSRAFRGTLKSREFKVTLKVTLNPPESKINLILKFFVVEIPMARVQWTVTMLVDFIKRNSRKSRVRPRKAVSLGIAISRLNGDDIKTPLHTISLSHRMGTSDTSRLEVKLNWGPMHELISFKRYYMNECQTKLISFRGKSELGPDAQSSKRDFYAFSLLPLWRPSSQIWY